MNNNLIYSRRSIRKFQNKPVALEIIKEVIRAGSAAPSAKNRQPWKCIVLGNYRKAEFLDAMEQGIDREENTCAMLPKSRNALPDAKNTLRIMREAPILIAIINSNGKSPFTELDTDNALRKFATAYQSAHLLKICYYRQKNLNLEHFGLQTHVFHMKN